MAVPFKVLYRFRPDAHAMSITRTVLSLDFGDIEVTDTAAVSAFPIHIPPHCVIPDHVTFGTHEDARGEEAESYVEAQYRKWCDQPINAPITLSATLG